MFGVKVGFFYLFWLDMNGEWIFFVFIKGEMWNVENFVNYDVIFFLLVLV